MRDILTAFLLSLGLSAVLAGISGCSDSGSDSKHSVATPTASPPSPATTAAQRSAHVIESFDVGPQVYVRSLAIEPEQNALWVGTSVGVQEVAHVRV